MELGCEGTALTTIVAVLFEEIVAGQLVGAAPEAIVETVMVELPVVINPVAVNVPVPAVPTVMLAVNPDTAGKLVL
jgi:hypothetical protein